MADCSSVISRIRGTGIPLAGNDIDTDRIIPARFMKCVTFDGLGEKAFFDERFDQKGNRREHPFNEDRYGKGQILVVGKNFGCGSSREHAPQSLRDFGINALIGESFAEIFAGNCTVMGMPAVCIEPADRKGIADRIDADPEIELEMDLDGQVVRMGGNEIPFTMPESSRQLLITGTWDTTSVLLAGRLEIEKTANRIPYLNGFSV